MTKVHLVYVPRMMKNILGHLPDLWYNYETLLKYFGCHTVTFDRSDITKSSLKPYAIHALSLICTYALSYIFSYMHSLQLPCHNTYTTNRNMKEIGCVKYKMTVQGTMVRSNVHQHQLLTCSSPHQLISSSAHQLISSSATSATPATSGTSAYHQHQHQSVSIGINQYQSA